MILNKKTLDFIINSPKMKEIYPMIDNVETDVIWDNDIENPFYKIHLVFYLNIPIKSTREMYDKNFDPHYLIDEYLIKYLNMVGVERRDISQIYIQVYDSNGELIYG